MVPPRPRVRGVRRVGVGGKKDLYEYWKGDIAECLLEDVQGKDSVESRTDEFLVVNVASQEVRLKSRGDSFRVDSCIHRDIFTFVMLHRVGIIRVVYHTQHTVGHAFFLCCMLTFVYIRR